MNVFMQAISNISRSITFDFERSSQRKIILGCFRFIQPKWRLFLRSLVQVQFFLLSYGIDRLVMNVLRVCNQILTTLKLYCLVRIGFKMRRSLLKSFGL